MAVKAVGKKFFHEVDFKSGWRPLLGWICNGALAYHYVIQPSLVFYCISNGHAITIPAFDLNSLYTILTASLGLGAMRTYEKVKGPDATTTSQ